MASAATPRYSLLFVVMSLLSLSRSGPPAICPGVDGGILSLSGDCRLK
jgi:hypothetical protein